MPIFSQLQTQDRALFVPFIADPPTTTLQRLKALTTGSLPTFVDVGANFASDEIMEDNIISQSFRHGKRIVFMGDDTWKALFPRHFYRSYPFPSFNVKDLHTVDNGIMKHLPEEMKKKDWNILIAHFLGVDHCGHRYGPMHDEMAAKLKQMNGIIREVESSLDNETVLFVMGDHGMTKTGDHGGDSDAEVKSALFVYSKSHLMFKPHDASAKEPVEVAQVDFVPTFSMLLGLPIPFSNLGSAIPDVFQDCDKAFLENALQVSRFLDTYATVSSQFPAPLLQEMDQTLLRVKELHTLLQSDPGLLPHVCKGYRDYLKKVKEICSARWAQFDIPTMILGISQLAMAVLFLALMLYNLQESNLKVLGCYIVSGIFVGVFSCVSTRFLLLLLNVHLLSFICLFSLLFPLAYMLQLIIASSTKQDHLSQTPNKKNISGDSALKEWIASRLSLKEFRDCFPSLVTMIYFVSFFSNSLVVNEDHVVTLLCQTLVIVGTASCCVATFQTKCSKTWRLGREIVAAVAMLICIRFGSLFFRCREEQEPCTDRHFLSTLAPSTQHTLHLLLAVVCLFVPVLALVIVMKRFSTNYNLSQLFVRYALPSSALCIVAHWSVSRAPERMLKKMLPGNREIAAKASVLLCAAVVFLIFIRPTSSPFSSALDKFAYTLGLNLLSVFAAVTFTLFLLAGDGHAAGLGVIIVCASLWAYVACHQDAVKGRDIQLGWYSAVVWAMFSSYGFFVTGHQAVFSSIHWNAAFVIGDGNSTGKLLPALTVALETFSSQILFSLWLPLLPVVYILLERQHLLSPHHISDITSYRSFLPIWRSSRASQFEASLIRLQLSFLLISGIKLLGAVWACAILRRHLMVWKIFAPRFVFEAVSCLMTVVMTLFAHLLTLRISSSISYYVLKES